MFAISRQALHDNFWLDLAGSSLFLLWIGLSCAAVLCRTRNWLHTLPAARASLIAITMLLGCIFVISELVYQIGRWWSSGVPGVIVAFPTDHAGFLLRSLGVGFIVSALALRYFYVSAEWKRSIEMEALARIRALQARIRPALPVQQHEHDRRADALLARARRAGRGGPGRSVSRQPERRHFADLAARTRSTSRARTSASSNCACATGCKCTGMWTNCRCGSRSRA
jgi:hypothetical protein